MINNHIGDSTEDFWRGLLFRTCGAKKFLCVAGVAFILFCAFLPLTQTATGQSDADAQIPPPLWFVPIIDPDVQMSALLECEADVGHVERPTDLATLEAAGFALPSMVEFDYSMLFENNIVYPCNDRAFRKAIHRLVDKAALAELLYPLQSPLEYWLPPSMGEWVADGGVDPGYPGGYRPEYRLPWFDTGMPDDTGTDSAYSWLNDNGYTMTTTPNPWYDEATDWASPYLRTWPGGEGVMPEFEYTTMSPVESPLSFEQSLIINEALHQAGINSHLVPRTHLEIVDILTNEVPSDYQLLSGIGLPYSFTPEPDILYDFYQSEQFPRWNVWVYSDPDMDAACDAMKSTLDYNELKAATMLTQQILERDEPMLPLMTKNGFWAFKSDVLWYVNMPGYGAGGARNRWTKMMIFKYPPWEPVVWILPTYIDSLNPLTAGTGSAWHVLESISGKAGEYGPRTLAYMPWALTQEPYQEEWIGPEGELGTHMYFELREGLNWHDGDLITAADAVFCLDLMRFQEVERYKATWQPIYDVVQTGTYTFEVYYLQRYYFAARDVADICLMTPKHIWEGWINPTIDEGAGPMGGDVWTGYDNHHSQWRGWENSIGADTYNGYPELELTELLGFGPYIYHMGGWEPGISVHIEWNPLYLAATGCPGDVNGDHYTDGLDVWHVLKRQGHAMWMPIWYQPLPWPPCSNPSLLGFDVDIAWPAGLIDGAENSLLQVPHTGHWWGPGDPPIGWVRCPGR